jgi:hypothetical protein
MKKNNYYVSVQASTILENQGDAAYEFIIHATPEEMNYLQDMMNEKMEYDDATSIRAHLPGLPYHQDVENDEYDDSLKQIYKKIYEYGDDAAKKTIASMGLDEVGTL